MSETNQQGDPILFPVHREIVRPEWVDYNNHMNVAYYVLVFDHATDAVFDRLDLGEAYRETTGCSLFVAEAHVTYEQEVSAGDRLRLTGQGVETETRTGDMYVEVDVEVPAKLTAEQKAKLEKAAKDAGLI